MLTPTGDPMTDRAILDPRRLHRRPPPPRSPESQNPSIQTSIVRPTSCYFPNPLSKSPPLRWERPEAGWRRSMRFAAPAFLLWLLLFAPLSPAHGAPGSAGGEGGAKKKNKFRERQATDDTLGYPNAYAQFQPRFFLVLTIFFLSLF